MMEFTFEQSPWEGTLDGLRPGDTLSGLRCLALLEALSQEEAEDALLELEQRGIALDITDLPKDGGSGELALRLRQDEQCLSDLARERLCEAVSGDGEAVIPAANAKARRAIDDVLARRKGAVPVEVREGGARALLCSADCATVASGTATLEAALARCPTVLVYKVGRLLGWFARLVIKGISHVGLANIIAEKAGARCPMPELLQEDFTAESLCRILKSWMTDAEARREAAERLGETMSLLKCDGDAIGKIVRLVLG